MLFAAAAMNGITAMRANNLIYEVTHQGAIEAEAERIVGEYQRRSQVLRPDCYAPWQVTSLLWRNEVTLRAAIMLRKAGKFPKRGEPCLEIGFGGLGWLGQLINWNLCESDLHGIELDAKRAAYVKSALPAADLRVGDAARLPWPSGTFRLAIASTVFSSILSPAVRHAVAFEICRVLAPAGALLWYDFSYNNPRNPNVRKVTRRELRRLFRSLQGEIRSVTLAPPLARSVAPISVRLAQVLEVIPFLRTHLLAVLIKQEEGPI
jgi:SAM-dependent methyltransferase